VRDRGGDRGRVRHGARLEQSPPRRRNRIVHRFLSASAHVDLAALPLRIAFASVFGSRGKVRVGSFATEVANSAGRPLQLSPES
jgi:hypothetical protein